MRLDEASATALKGQFLALLDEGLPEQRYQEFIERNTALVPREFEQNHGIHLSIVLRKLGFGADYVSDLFYLSKSSDDWHAVFVELEKPTTKFFKQGSNEFSAEFQLALQQINEWRAWLDRPGNKDAFLNNDVRVIRVPRHMAVNPTDFKFVLVTGRRSEYEGNDIRRSLVRAQERADFKILTYDSLVENLARKYSLYIGARHNEFLDILSDDLADTGIFSWIDPSELQVSPLLLEAMRKGVPSNHFRFGTDGKTVDVLEWAVDKVRVRTR